MTHVPAARWVRHTKLPRWLLLSITAVFVFVAGLAVPYARSVRLEARLEATTRALTVAQLENMLLTAALEARRGRYESARQLASDFFTQLQTASAELPADARDEVRAVLAHRDSTITLLSRGVGTSADLLDRILTAYRDAQRAAGSTRQGSMASPRLVATRGEP